MIVTIEFIRYFHFGVMFALLSKVKIFVFKEVLLIIICRVTRKGYYMSLRLLKTITAVFLLKMSLVCNASIITHGNLMSDDSTDYIVDTRTDRHYTRFDAFNLTFDEVETAIGVGGDWEGWSIVNSAIMDEFYTALLGTQPLCLDNSISGKYCGTVSNWNTADFGSSYSDTATYFGYVDYSQAKPISVGKIYAEGWLVDYPGWGNESLINYYGQTNETNKINMMLYNDNVQAASTPQFAPASVAPASVTSVPEPSTISLLMLGMIGIVFRRYKNK